MIYFEDKVHVFYFLKKLSKWLSLLEKWVSGSFFFVFFSWLMFFQCLLYYLFFPLVFFRTFL